MNTSVQLILSGKYDKNGALLYNETRLVLLDIAKYKEALNLQRITNPETKNRDLVLRSRDGGWWGISDIYILEEPTDELHDDLYPVAHRVMHETLEEMLNAYKSYWIIVEEWNYPTESGRDPLSCTFNTKEEALAECFRLATSELSNFTENVKEDAISPGYCDDGYIITTKCGLDPFYYFARAIKVEKH